MLKASYLESWEVDERLKDLGIKASVLQEAVEIGELYRSECTLNDPKSLPGFLAWGRTTRALRERLLPLGWERYEEMNLPMVIHKGRKIAIVVSSGDEATGHAAIVAKTKYAKGRATEGVVIKNAVQLALFESFEKVRPLRPDASSFITWFLLVSRQEDQIYFELSLPNRVHNGKPVGNWAERILFHPIQLNTLPSDNEQSDREQEEIIVEISRRE